MTSREIIADVDADDSALSWWWTPTTLRNCPTTSTVRMCSAIIDHHKLVGGLETKGPINITIRPLACTATIMHNLMGPNADKMTDADQRG